MGGLDTITRSTAAALAQAEPTPSEDLGLLEVLLIVLPWLLILGVIAVVVFVAMGVLRAPLRRIEAKLDRMIELMNR